MRCAQLRQAKRETGCTGKAPVQPASGEKKAGRDEEIRTLNITDAYKAQGGLFAMNTD